MLTNEMTKVSKAYISDFKVISTASTPPPEDGVTCHKTTSSIQLVNSNWLVHTV
ncbi:hypothetical protein D039_0218A, partial [Vibrio parahaemolyticus EKP-028]